MAITTHREESIRALNPLTTYNLVADLHEAYNLGYTHSSLIKGQKIHNQGALSLYADFNHHCMKAIESRMPMAARTQSAGEAAKSLLRFFQACFIRPTKREFADIALYADLVYTPEVRTAFSQALHAHAPRQAAAFDEFIRDALQHQEFTKLMDTHRNAFRSALTNDHKVEAIMGMRAALHQFTRHHQLTEAQFNYVGFTGLQSLHGVIPDQEAVQRINSFCETCELSNNNKLYPLDHLAAQISALRLARTYTTDPADLASIDLKAVDIAKAFLSSRFHHAHSQPMLCAQAVNCVHMQQSVESFVQQAGGMTEKLSNVTKLSA